MQGAPRAPLADWRRGLGFGFPWSRNRFRAHLAPALDDGAALPGLPGWTVLHTPGHADDSICLYHATARFLVTGDTVRNFLGGEWNQLTCDAADYAATKGRLRALDVETVFPGHGPILQGKGILGRLRSLPCFMP
jgi:glyoxylase-like metal-dependent hydrolase (beta-lactamase superfamily II)